MSTCSNAHRDCWPAHLLGWNGQAVQVTTGGQPVRLFATRGKPKEVRDPNRMAVTLAEQIQRFLREYDDDERKPSYRIVW